MQLCVIGASSRTGGTIFNLARGATPFRAVAAFMREVIQQEPHAAQIVGLARVAREVVA